MPADGIDAVVLYPSLAMFFGPCDEIPALRDVAFVADCQRAYNDWLADFCSEDPRRLKGEQIPLSARIFAVVDVWDALRSDRPYRAGWPDSKVRAYLREQAGIHFEPAVLETFMML